MKKEKIIFLAIILLATILRLAFLNRIPNGFIPEEVSTGWNAYSLLKTGRDEWGVFLPIIFKETGGYKLALNSYLIVPVMAVLGVNEFAVRLPTALAGVIAVILTYYLTLLLFKSPKAALMASLLLAISPWHIAVGRYGVDVNWGVPLFLAGLIFLIKAKTKPKLLILSGIFFALTYYTYFNYVVFTVLFLLGYGWWQRGWLMAQENRRWVISFLIIQFLFMLPYILQPALFIRFGQATSVGNIGIVNRTNEHRGACQATFPSVLCKLFYNKFLSGGWEIARNYVNHYSTTTLFLYGSELGLSGMPERWGFFYLLEFPLIILGFVALLKTNKFPFPLLLWLILYGLPSSLAGEAHIWRMFTLLPVLQIIAGFGIIWVYQEYKQRRLHLGIALLLGFFVARFLVDYLGYFPYAQASNAYYGFRQVYQYLAPIEKNYQQIVVAPSSLGFDQLYIYYLFYRKFDPAKFQANVGVSRITGDQHWVKVPRIGNYRFENDIRSIISEIPDHTIYVSDGSFNEQSFARIKDVKLLNVIKYPNGDPAFKIIELNNLKTSSPGTDSKP